MEQGQLNWIASFSWGIADDVLRDEADASRDGENEMAADPDAAPAEADA